MADTIVVFYFFNAFVVRGSLPGYGDWTPPASSGGWICRKSVAFYYLAAIMSRNSAVFRREDSHSPSCLSAALLLCYCGGPYLRRP